MTDSSGKPLAAEEYTLRYRYTPFEGRRRMGGTHAPDLFDGVPAAGMYGGDGHRYRRIQGSTKPLSSWCSGGILSRCAAAGGDYVYNGAEQKPEEITEVWRDHLQKGVDYTVAGTGDNKSCGRGGGFCSRPLGTTSPPAAEAVFRIGKARQSPAARSRRSRSRSSPRAARRGPPSPSPTPIWGDHSQAGTTRCATNNTAAGEATAVITGIETTRARVEKPFRITIRTRDST